MSIYKPASAIIILAFCVSQLFAQTSSKPNIIYILADDIGYDIPTVNGGQSFRTPTIDSIARQGMNFTHCEASPLCCPSRFMFLTGKLNFRNYSNWGYMNSSEKTVGNLLKDAGYTTGFFGKLQLEYNGPAQMKNWGWDKFTIFELTDDSLPERRYKSPNLVDNNGRVSESITKNKYCDDILTTRILNFIDDNKNKPFFIYYPMSIGHAPFQPTPDDPEYASWDPNSTVSDTSFFPSMMFYMDKKVAQILSKLKNTGLDTNTIVFYVGDNGTPIPIHYKANGVSVTGEKGMTVEGGTHVPMIAYWPKHIAPRGVNDDLIDLTDFFPTFADLAKRTTLSKYGVLDGVSFYNRLFKKTDSVKQALFSHYDPNPGQDELDRWVRDKTYKLYDSTNGNKAGNFYNIQTDKEEQHPLVVKQLTPKENRIRSKFKSILNAEATWPDAPLVTNAVASNIGVSSATLTAKIVNAGASQLVERGSTYSITDPPYYRFNRLEDSQAVLGTFSQKRTGLLAQRKYSFSIYGMNANSGNSTAYAVGSFTTLSRAPLNQSTSLIASNTGCAVHITWRNAVFPATGATKGGYLLLYTTNSVVLNAAANGHAPGLLSSDLKIRKLNLTSILPALPSASADINSLSPDSLYYFTLVPYTWNGISDATYNYLTDGALSTIIKPIKNGCETATNSVERGEVVSAFAKMKVTPNPSASSFTLHIDKAYLNTLLNVRVCDAVGKVYYQIESTGKNSYTFGGDLKKGVYFIYLKAGKQEYQYKVIKN